jgi:hypothetical protein
MEEITLQIQRDEQSGRLVAWWDDPDGAGGITTPKGAVGIHNKAPPEDHPIGTASILQVAERRW